MTKEKYYHIVKKKDQISKTERAFIENIKSLVDNNELLDIQKSSIDRIYRRLLQKYKNRAMRC